MHFWIPVLLVEGFVLWLAGRKPKGDEVSDEAIGRAVATIGFGSVFLVADAVLLIARNW